MNEPIVIGHSLAARDIRALIKLAGQSDSNILISGETGVGKELAARAIHCASVRKDKPFVKINCACLCEGLVESELFGHKKGSYTGAFIDRPGLLEAANFGTFFFDEIGDLSLNLQAKLLTVIEDKEIRRVGENFSRPLDIRYIFATNRDLRALISRRLFREDLYYRINILTFPIRPLRERKEDIPLLINEFLNKEDIIRKKCISIDTKALEKLSTYDFPGNIRELMSIILRAMFVSANNTITEDDISFANVTSTANKFIKKKHTRHDIIEALANSNGNKTKAAKQLGISRVHLYRLLNNI